MKLKKEAKITLIVISVIVLAIIIGTITMNFADKLSGNKIETIKEIPEYGYKLNSNANNLYQSMFAELEKILHADELDKELYASKISEMFVVDFYSLADKTSKYDIGGLDFIHPTKKEDFVENATNTIYNHVETTIDNDRKQKLPKVLKTSVESVEQTSFEYLDTISENAYKIYITWEYEEDLGYQTSATMYFVEEQGKLQLVELINE